MKRLATDILEHISTTGIVRNTVRTALCLLLPAFALSGARADCQPTPNGLVSWWPGDGSGADLVGTNHGILLGGVTANASAWVDRGFSFDGTNGFVQIPDSVALKPAQLTVEVWVKFDSLYSRVTGAPAGVQFLVHKQNSRPSNWFSSYALLKDETHHLGFDLISSNQTEVFVASSSVVQTGVWYHVTGVRGSNYAQLYVNGQLAQQASVNFAQDYGNYPLYLGTSGQPTYDGRLKGQLDEVTLYNRALSAGEIAALYAAGAAGKCKGPKITLQPQSQAIAIGGLATFTVTATGSGVLTYQWRLNDVPLPGATNTTLTVTDLKLTDQGNYSVAVSNTLGLAISSNAWLQVTAPQPGAPYIISMNPVTGAPGTNVTLTGFNFSATAANNIVHFGAVRGEVVTASSNLLTVTVPVGATFARVNVDVDGLVANSPQNFLPTFNGNGAAVSGTTFAAGQNLAGGDGCHRTTIADLDGDSWPDLLIANVYGHTISLFRNLGSGGPLSPSSFAARVDFPALAGGSDNPFGVIAADVDGDGKLDLVFTERVNNRIGIHRNQSSAGALGTGSFAAALYFSTGTDPRYVRVADLDRDGRPDIVVCNTGAGTISVFRNLSPAGILDASSFATRVDLASGAGAHDVAIQDLDGDDRADLAVVNANAGTLSLFRNISAPGTLNASSFAPRVDLPANGDATIVAGDVDGDGRPDLISGGNSTALSIFRNLSTTGSLTINSFAPKVDYGNPGWVHNVALGDVNGDAQADVVAVGELGSYLRVYQNQSSPGTVTLAAGVDYAAGWNAWGVSVGDLDGDLRSDIVFCNAYDDTVTLYRNQQPFGGPPLITDHPDSQTVIMGFAATLDVTASGNFPLSYQWLFNGTNILSATNATLTLTNLQIADSGNYSVHITNVIGVTTSSNAVLTVIAPSCLPAPAGLIGWWQAEDNGLDAASGNLTTLSNGVLFTAGNVGQGFNFDGTNDLIHVTPSATLNVGTNAGFTIEAWINPASVGGQQPLVEWNDPFAGKPDGLHFWISVPGPGSLYVNVVDTGGNNHTFSSPGGIVTANTFQHVAVTYDKTTGAATFYYNGTAVAAQNLGIFTPQTTFPLYFGHRPMGGQSIYRGLLDEISIYNRALTPAEIQSVWQSTTLGHCVTPPGFVQPLPNPLAAVGGNLTLAATTTGAQPMSYQWYFNNSALTNDAHLSGATSEQLTLTAVQTNDAGNYWLVASNVAGVSTSSVATVQVGFAPTIVLQPLSQTQLIGTTMTFLTVATGSEPLSYQWYQNTTALTNDLRYFGVTSANLTITNLVVGDSGNYTLHVSNLFGQTTSLVATLVVPTPPNITTQPQSQVVPAGTNLILYANSLGSEPMSYQWYFNGAPLTNSVGYAYGSTISPTLYITNVQAVHAGDYHLVITNAAGSVQSTIATLTVTPVPATILQHPSSGTATKGAQVTLAASATGSEPIAYQWLFNSNLLAGATGNSIVFTNVQFTDAGAYALVVSNDLLTVTSSTATLTVTPPPGFLWTRKAGGANADEGRSIARDSQGNIYVAGNFLGSATFGTNNLVSIGFGSTTDFFLAKYDPAGQLLWVRSGGSSSTDSVNGVAVDAAGNACIVGSVGAFPNLSGMTLNVRGSMDAFVAKYSNAGDLLWVTNFGGTATAGLAESANAVAMDSTGRIYITGNFNSTGFFGGTIVSNSLTSATFTARCSTDGNVEWVRASSGNATATGAGIALDSQTNVLVAGSFSPTFVTFGSVTITNNFTSPTAAFTDAFVAKYDANGNVLWAQKAGGSSSDAARRIAVDGGGNSYVIGDFNVVATFGGTTFTAPGQTPDVFLMKCDPGGNILWAIRAGGTSTDAAGGVTVDSGGNVFITGSYSGTGNFGGIYSSSGISPNGGIGGGFVGGTNLTNAGGTDAFVAMYTAAGEFRWVRKAGGSSTDVGRAVVTDDLGGLFLSGSFSSAVTFGHESHTSTGGTDFFLSKLAAFDSDLPAALVAQPVNQTNAAGSAVTLSAGVIARGPIGYQWQFNGADIPGATNISLTLYNLVATNAGVYSVNITTPNGNLSSTPATLTVVTEPDFLWSRHIGGANNDECLAVAADTNGNTYAAGYFSGTTDFGGTNLTSNGGEDVFIGKLDAAHNLVWLRQIGGTNNDRATALALDGAGNLIVAGQFSATADFGGTNLTSFGSNDVFLAKLDAAGALVWTRQAGGTNSELVRGIAVHTNGDIAIAGSFQAIADFGGIKLTNKNLTHPPLDGDVFVARYDSNGQLLWVKGAGSSSEDRARGVTFDRAGNIFIAGGFNTSATFDSIILNSVRKSLEIFVAKYNPAGNVVWARAPGTATTDTTIFAFDDEATALATDGNGNVFVAGYFQSLGIFSSNTVVSASTNAPDLFLTKYDDAGNALWVRTSGGGAADSALALATDAAGNALVAGSFAGPAQFGAQSITGIGGSDAFAAMYDATGNLLKVRKLGGMGDDAGQALVYDGRGNIVLGGFHTGPAAIGATALPGAGGRDAFVAKLSLYDPDLAPAITGQPMKQTVGYGKPFDLDVGVTSGASLAYQWLFNNAPLSGATNSALRITNFQYAAVGDYSVIITNAFGAVTSSVATVTVEIFPEFPWLQRVGSTGDDQALALGMDAQTNLYMAGYFSGTTLFTNSIYGTNVSLVSTGLTDIFLTKYNAAGKLLWARQAGGNREDVAQAVAIDTDGNIFLTGYFRSFTARFGSMVLTNPSVDFHGEIFVTKYDPEGNALWARRAGGSLWDVSRSIAVDGAGDAYITGYCYWLATFGSITLTNGNSNSPTNYFVSKFSSNGDVLWAKNARSTIYDGGTPFVGGVVQGFGLCLDASTNVIVTGHLTATADFGNGNPLVNLNSTAQGGSVFLTKYDQNGNLLWAKKGIGSTAGIGQAVCADKAGNLYATSYRPTSGITALVLAKYDSNGFLLWTRGVSQGNGQLLSGSLGLDADGNILMVGGVSGVLTFEGTSLSNVGFVSKYRPDGVPLWVMRVGGWCYGIIPDATGGAYLAGRYSGTGFFGPSGTNTLAPLGGTDIFFVKLGVKSPTAAPQTFVKTIATDAGTTLQVTTTGTGPFAYQWRFNGTNIPGATGSSYLLTGAKWTNAGLYSVVISNTAGSFVSAPAAVNVTPKLYSEPAPGGVLLTWGGQFTLQSAPNSAGPFTDVSGATSPHLHPTSNDPLRFFRLKSEPFALVISNQATGVNVSGAGISGYNFILQTSTNFLNWTPVATNPSPFSIPAPNDAPQRFYRALMAQ